MTFVYKSICLMVLAALASGCANHEARDKLGIADPSARESGWATPQTAEAGALDRKKMLATNREQGAAQDPGVAREALTADTWMQQHGPYMKNRSAGLDGLQQRMKPLAARNDYYSAKAQCWIDAGREEQAARNGWGFVEEAMSRADTLITGMELNARSLPAGNPAMRTSTTVRPDLWRRINGFKIDPRMPYCPPAQKRVACQEVRLMHAGHDAWARNYDAAQKKAEAVEAQLVLGGKELENCSVPQATKPAPPPPPMVVLPPVINLDADALFAFDRSDRKGMMPEGAKRLDHLAAALKQVNAVKSVTIVGHTDRFGDARYNEQLSLKRAQTVMAYLRANGVTVPMTASGKGSAAPVVSCPGPQTNATIKCLQPNRRVEIRVAQ
ncbi:OmpA family protein [Uliginosibacterium sp. sgz301328]|uniref:OmpA family protein n=1 Tax=Uliginosibacterium sp. sgz301328 TaxID=3243764 RepID=UPI00359F0E1E